MQTMQLELIPQADNQPEKQARNALIYNGAQIHEKGERLSLTDMWKAAGANDHQQPKYWLRQEGVRTFIDALATAQNVIENHLLKIERGKSGGTWAHWQIASAYAKYLSPDFHMWCNQVVRDHMEGKPNPKATTLTDYDRSIIGNMVKNCAGIVIREELGTLIPALVEARLLKSNILVRHGKTAGEIWRAHNLPRLKNAALWLGNRLTEMGCAIENAGRCERGSYTIRLFDPDKADICLRNGLLHTAKIYAQERQGQKRLRLVSSIPQN